MAATQNERILGSGDFVEQIINEAEAQIKYQLPVKEQHQKIDEFIIRMHKTRDEKNDLIANQEKMRKLVRGWAGNLG